MLHDDDRPQDEIMENKPLRNPIKCSEVRKARKKLKTNRSTGPNEIENELITHSGQTFAEIYTKQINKCFSNGHFLEATSQGNLNPLPKPKKKAGSISNLRPITLLNGMRKMLFLITPNRIEEKIDKYTGPFQHGFKSGESCADIVWTQQILTSMVLRKKLKYHKMSIDMSRAFDTIKRKTILNLLEDAGCTDDEIRQVKFLLTDTKIRIKLNKTTSEEFDVTLGSFQGNSIPGKPFTLYLAGALNHLRAIINRPNPPISSSSMPLEMEYVDDCDFIDENKQKLQDMLPQIEQTFRQWNLKVNPDKTKFSEIYVAEEKEREVKKNGDLKTF